MRTNELIERYVSIVEQENEIRSEQIRLLRDSLHTVDDARRFIEMMIMREIPSHISSPRRNPLGRPQPTQSTRSTRSTQPTRSTRSTQSTQSTQSPQMEMHGISIDIPASAVSGELGLLRQLFGFLEEPSATRFTGLTDEEIDTACISREWDETIDCEELPTCPITLERFSQGDMVKKIRRCGHEFSAGAITQALRLSPLCPLCRATVMHS